MPWWSRLLLVTGRTAMIVMLRLWLPGRFLPLGVVRSRRPSSAGGALENVGRERAGLDAQLPPVVQAAADLIEPVA
jgi:hypothetical protein